MDTQTYWQAVQQKVCANCVDNNGSGKCQIDSSIDCALRLYFPRIVQTLTKVHSTRLEDYVRALRSTVCVECKYQAMDGSCALRLQTECVLDRYFPLIVEAIEEVRSEAPT